MPARKRLCESASRAPPPPPLPAGPARPHLPALAPWGNPLSRRLSQTSCPRAAHTRRHRDGHQAQPEAAAWMLRCPVRPEGRRPVDGGHLHLLACEEGRRADQQLAGPCRDAGTPRSLVQQKHGRPQNVSSLPRPLPSPPPFGRADLIPPPAAYCLHRNVPKTNKKQSISPIQIATSSISMSPSSLCCI